MALSSGWIVKCIMSFLFLCGCQVSFGDSRERFTIMNITPGTHSFKVEVKRVQRRYLVHVPPVYNSAKKWPVVIMFHGGGGTARNAMKETGWEEKADKEGFLAVFPEGTRPRASRPARFLYNPQTWNEGSGRANVGAAQRDEHDVEFVAILLKDLNSRFQVDEKRIYFTGFSNGASMVFRVARELSSFVAAVAPVAGGDWTDMRPTHPVPLIYITGTADPLNPIGGGEVHLGRRNFGWKPSTREMIDKWLKTVECPEKPHVIYKKNGVTGIAYGKRGESAKVVLYTIKGHGHHWPGGESNLPASLAGENTAIINATDVIWEFFKKHSADITDTR